MRQLLAGSISRIDLAVWVAVILFFCGSSTLFHGNLQLSFIGAAGVIVEMLIIGVCIEIIIEALKPKKGIGTITGFITNGPEALCLIVGLAVGDILFAASTPLGSNFMNPVLLVIAALLCSMSLAVFRCKPFYTGATVLLTIIFSISFFLLPEAYYPWWAAGVCIITIPLFLIRPKESSSGQPEEILHQADRWLWPAIIILICTGYFLDSVVGFAAEHSKAPKGVIGFFILATLSSWPEFKSCLSLLSRGKTLSAILNITVSNITNIWLAVIGVATYLALT